MAPLLKTAFVASVALHLQQNASLCFAADPSSEDNQLLPRPSWGGMSLFGDDFPFGRSIFENMAGFMDMMNFRPSLHRPNTPSISISPVVDEDKACRVSIKLSKGASLQNVQLTLKPEIKTLLAAFDLTEESETKGPHGSQSKRSQQVHIKNSISLPETCIATAAAAEAGLIGYALDAAAADASVEHKGLIIFPSAELLNRYKEEGLLPENIVELVEQGDKEMLAVLTPEQMCLAAGFKLNECLKMNNIKPGFTDSGVSAEAGGVAVPMYDVALSQFNSE